MRIRAAIPVICGLMAMPVVAAEPPVRLSVKPSLCVLAKDATACKVSFDIRWKSALAAQYCLNEEMQLAPLRCWTSALTGDLQHEKLVTREFSFWLSPPGSAQRAAEAKVDVLRTGSSDRRRERRSRHVWDVL